jgi:hypothetical protein
MKERGLVVEGTGITAIKQTSGKMIASMDLLCGFGLVDILKLCPSLKL